VLYQLSYIPTGRGDLEDCTRHGGHLSKRMKHSLCAAGLVLALVAQLSGPQPARAGATVQLADNRCNDETIDEASGRVSDYDRHPPGNGAAQLLQRYAALSDVLAMMSEERQILESLCSTDAQRAPLFARIAATSAWTLALESDVAARLNASCPAAATGLPAMMLSDAWLSLANVVNDENGTVPTEFSTVVPKVQSRAQAVGLTLPSWADTSAYWRDQVHLKEKAAIATCPSPSPAPSPT
jgi:hypothetical protein